MIYSSQAFNETFKFQFKNLYLKEMKQKLEKYETLDEMIESYKKQGLEDAKSVLTSILCFVKSKTQVLPFCSKKMKHYYEKFKSPAVSEIRDYIENNLHIKNRLIEYSKSKGWEYSIASYFILSEILKQMPHIVLRKEKFRDEKILHPMYSPNKLVEEGIIDEELLLDV